MDDLVKRLSKDLGVTKTQAKGGLIALLRAGQQNMQRADFEQFVADIPGADKLLKNSPPPSTLSSLAGGLGSLFGGRNSPGRWAGLAASFTELGIDLDTAKKFGPIVIDFVKEHGGENLVKKLRSALQL
ncbi:MAG: DUF2780 domain-containing protein [Steroidobacteraceae bacterium]